MEIEDIRRQIASVDAQDRLRAVVALREFAPEVAVPLLLSCQSDAVFTVRSFVAMGLGRKQTDAAYAALLRMLSEDEDHNVRAEAANSLAHYGPASVPILRETFRGDENWLVRRSILAAMTDLPDRDALYEMCQISLAGDDVGLREAAIGALALLVDTPHAGAALEHLLELVGDAGWNIRYRVALALRSFAQPQARAALQYLGKDDDPRVAGATLEPLA